MPKHLEIQLPGPVTTVNVIGPSSEVETINQRLAQQGAERASLASACAALQKAFEQIRRAHQEFFKQAEAQLPALAVDIARKVLMQEIDAGHYQIEPIVRQVLSRIAPNLNMVVHLSPADLERSELTGSSADKPGMANVQFVGDAEVSPGECFVETSEGVVTSSIEEHLSEIAETLKTLE